MFIVLPVVDDDDWIWQFGSEGRIVKQLKDKSAKTKQDAKSKRNATKKIWRDDGKKLETIIFKSWEKNKKPLQTLKNRNFESINLLRIKDHP